MVLELLNEHRIIGIVIGPRQQYWDIISQRDSLEPLGAFLDGAFGQVAYEMAGRGARTPIATDKNRSTIITSPLEDCNNALDIF